MKHDGPPTPPRHSRGPSEVPLALTAADFREAGYAMVDRVADLLEGLPDRAVTLGQGPDAIRAKLDASATLPVTGKPAGEILAHAADLRQNDVARIAMKLGVGNRH